MHLAERSSWDCKPTDAHRPLVRGLGRAGRWALSDHWEFNSFCTSQRGLLLRNPGTLYRNPSLLMVFFPIGIFLYLDFRRCSLHAGPRPSCFLQSVPSLALLSTASGVPNVRGHATSFPRGCAPIQPEGTQQDKHWFWTLGIMPYSSAEERKLRVIRLPMCESRGTHTHTRSVCGTCSALREAHGCRGQGREPSLAFTVSKV